MGHFRVKFVKMHNFHFVKSIYHENTFHVQNMPPFIKKYFNDEKLIVYQQNM